MKDQEPEETPNDLAFQAGYRAGVESKRKEPLKPLDKVALAEILDSVAIGVVERAKLFSLLQGQTS